MNKDLNITQEEYKEITKETKFPIRLNKNYFGKVNIKYINFKNIQKQIFLLKEIFTPEKKAKKISKFPVIHINDKDKEYFDNIFQKKFKKDYIDKITTLLYNSKNKKDYSKKRANIKRAIYKLDENQKFYLTLPKLKEGRNNQKGFVNNKKIFGMDYNYIKTETTDYTNTNTKNKISSTEQEDKLNAKNGFPLNENINELLNEQDNMDKYEEDKGRLLYEKLRTKYNNFDLDLSKNDSKNKKGRKYWSKINKRKIQSDYQLIATPQQIGEFDYNLGQAFIKGKFRFLTNKQKENLGYIGELNLFNSMNRLKEKQNMLKEMKGYKKNKRNILMPIDVFKYDAEKWKKYTYEKNKNNNDVIINELNEKNKIKLDDMKGYIDKLNIDSYSYDKDVTNIINNIDLFLDKYGVDSVFNVTRKNSKNSEYSPKTIRSSFKKKEKDNKNIKEDEKKEEQKLESQES